MLELQDKDDFQTYYMVADLHTVTTPYEKTTLRGSIRNIIIDYLSAGLDPQKSTLFIQSMVHEHIELSYYFSTVTTVAKMQHVTTFKDKVKQHPEHVTMALLNYPVLMSADILLYKASLVPVGIDQEPHLEIAREVARRMNQEYGTSFPEPRRFATKGEYVPSLSGEGKMSKSVEGSYINLTDSHEEITKKIRSIPTATVAGGELTGGLRSLFSFAELFLPDQVENYRNAFQKGTLKFVELKDAVADAIYHDLESIQEKHRAVEQNISFVDDVIADGAQRARLIASKTLQEVKEKMGMPL